MILCREFIYNRWIPIFVVFGLVPRNHDIQCTTKGISNRRHTKKYQNDEMKSQGTSHLPSNHENRWHYSIYKGQGVFLTSVTRRVPLVEQELFSVPNGMGLFLLFRGVCVDQSLLFCVYVMSTIACPFLSVIVLSVLHRFTPLVSSELS